MEEPNEKLHTSAIRLFRRLRHRDGRGTGAINWWRTGEEVACQHRAEGLGGKLASGWRRGACAVMEMYSLLVTTAVAGNTVSVVTDHVTCIFTAVSQTSKRALFLTAGSTDRKWLEQLQQLDGPLYFLLTLFFFIPLLTAFVIALSAHDCAFLRRCLEDHNSCPRQCLRTPQMSNF